jgi:hypothetical protein
MRNRLLIIFIFILLGLGILGYSLVKAVTYHQIASDLSDRLVEQDVLVKTVLVNSIDPFQLEVILLRPDDPPLTQYQYLRAKYLTRWEATQLNRERYILNSYIVNVIDENGETISWEQTYLYPETQVEANTEEQEVIMSESQAEDYIRQGLDYRHFQIIDLDIVSESRSGQLIHTLVMKLSSQNLGDLNLDLPFWMPELRLFLADLNKQHISEIDVCWLEIVSSEGAILLDYIYDLDLTQETWWMSEGVTEDWFPHPVPIPIDPLYQPTLAPYPSPANPRDLDNPYP